MTYCTDCIHYKVCGNEGVDDVAMTYCADKQTDGDLISRADLLNKIWQKEYGIDYDGVDLLNIKHIDIIEQMPSAEKTANKININEYIKVKLTDYGKEIFYHQYDNINKTYGKEIIKPSYPTVDSDGYTSFQLWYFMNLYGRHIDMGVQNVIEPLEIVFESAEKPAEWVIKKTKQRTNYKTAQTGHCYWLHEQYVCSNCGEKPLVERADDCADEVLSNYCPNCGAKMKGAKE